MMILICNWFICRRWLFGTEKN